MTENALEGGEASGGLAQELAPVVPVVMAKFGFVTEEGHQWRSQHTVTLDKVSVEVRKAQEMLKFLDGLWVGPGLYHFYFFITYAQSLRADVKS